MYKIGNNPKTNQPSCILNLQNNTCIPFDPDNTDYQAYLAWVAEGNTPESAE